MNFRFFRKIFFFGGRPPTFGRVNIFLAKEKQKQSERVMKRNSFSTRKINRFKQLGRGWKTATAKGKFTLASRYPRICCLALTIANQPPTSRQLSKPRSFISRFRYIVMRTCSVKFEREHSWNTIDNWHPRKPRIRCSESGYFPNQLFSHKNIKMAIVSLSKYNLKNYKNKIKIWKIK